MGIKRLYFIMNKPIFNKVYESLETHHQIKHVEKRNIKETNKRQVKYDIGGCYRQRFYVELTENAKIDGFKLGRILRKQHNSLLTANDKPKRLININTEGSGEYKNIYVDVYIIPDPE